jgi:hypothetical protein
MDGIEQSYQVPRSFQVLLYRNSVRVFRRSDAPIIDPYVLHGVTSTSGETEGPIRTVYIIYNPRVERGFERMRQQIHFLYHNGRIQWMMWNMYVVMRLLRRLRIEMSRPRLLSPHIHRVKNTVVSICQYSRDCHILWRRILRYLDYQYETFRRQGIVGMLDEEIARRYEHIRIIEATIAKPEECNRDQIQHWLDARRRSRSYLYVLETMRPDLTSFEGFQ